jgi:ornithine cyclodeaminase
MKIFNIDQIQESINITKDLQELINSQKAAFIDYSAGLYDVASPMQFIFPKAGSDCHIKSGYKQGSQHFVVKIASSSRFGNNGLILVFDVESCQLRDILQDKGFLTTFRTAIAGIICLSLMPWTLQNIGIIGSGSLAKQLYELVRAKYPQANILLYGRNKVKAAAIGDLVCESAQDLVAKCDVVFTTTSSVKPIIYAIPESRNIAIIGLGSDDEHKSELSPELFKTVDIVIVDSKLQAAKFGDVSTALKAGIVSQDALMELGVVLKLGIYENIKTIIADFSGIGPQDVAIAEFVLSRLVQN